MPELEASCQKVAQARVFKAYASASTLGLHGKTGQEAPHHGAGRSCKRE